MRASGHGASVPAEVAPDHRSRQPRGVTPGYADAASSGRLLAFSSSVGAAPSCGVSPSLVEHCNHIRVDGLAQLLHGRVGQNALWQAVGEVALEDLGWLAVALTRDVRHGDDEREQSLLSEPTDRR